MLENERRKGTAMNIEIAQRLYELRRKHGFSQESLAAELGLSRQAISKWERSESAPDMGNLIALADLYNMTIDELIRPASKDGEGDSFSDDDGSAETSYDAEIVEVAECGEDVEAEDTTPDEAAAEAAPAIETGSEAETGPGTETGPASAPLALEGATTGPGPDTSIDPAIKQAVAHGHIYTKPPVAAAPKCKLRSFPYPLFVTVLFLILALVFGMWEYVWLFLTIPFYYWVARIIERDPNFLESHDYTPGEPAAQPFAPVSETSDAKAVDQWPA